MKDLYKSLNEQNRNAPIYVDDGTLLSNKGFRKVPLTINWTTIDKILKKHGILHEELYLLREQIEDCILVANSFTREGSIIIFIKQWDESGREIMLSIALNEKDNEMNVSRITSIYGRDNTENFIKKLYEENKIIAFDKLGGKWLEAVGIKLPNELSSFDYVKERLCPFSIAVFIVKKKLTPPIEL